MKQKHKEITVRTFKVSLVAAMILAIVSVITRNFVVLVSSIVLACIPIILILFMYYINIGKKVKPHKDICKNCGERIRGLIDEPNTPVHIHSELRTRRYDTLFMAEWTNPHK